MMITSRLLESRGMVGNSAVAAALLSASSLLLSCTGSPQEKIHAPVSTQQPAGGLESDVTVEQGSGQPTMRAPVQMRGSGQMIRGRDEIAAATPQPTLGGGPGASSDGFQLSFIDTELAVVVSSVLGDGLNVPHLIDPQLKGTMTLQATRPLSRDEVLGALEAALRIQGVAIVEVNGVYNVVPIKDAPRRVTGLRLPSDALRPGFAVQIVPLKFVSVADIEKILRPFSPEGAVLRSDEARNLLVLAGTSQELATMLEIVRTFDVDWLAGMSFALYPLEYSDAKAIADELAQIFSDPTSPIDGVVRVLPLSRLNSLMVVTQQATYLSKIESWIRQLDIGTASPGRRLYVYDVQNGKAGDLAESLNRILALTSDSNSTGNFDSGTASRQSAMGSGSASSNTNAGVASSSQSSDRAFSSSAGVGSTADANSMRLVPNDETNALLIYSTPSEFTAIERALKRLDVQPVQVLIEASLAEVSLNDDLRFGLQWAYESSRGPMTLSEAASGAISQIFPGFSYLYTGRQDIQAVLNTLESLTNVKVISSPKLLVLNNHEASLQVGDQVPVVTQSSVGTVGENAPIVNSVEMRDTGVILRITPRANKSGSVLLEIGQEVSDVVRTTTSAINSPTIQQRKLSSTVVVHDGETIALGGLIRENKSQSRSGLPLVSRIPLVGALFGSTSNNSNRTELIVLITPRVIRSKDEAIDVMDDLRDEFRGLKKLIPEWKASPVKTDETKPSDEVDALATKPVAEAVPNEVIRSTQGAGDSADKANVPEPVSDPMNVNEGVKALPMPIANEPAKEIDRAPPVTIPPAAVPADPPVGHESIPPSPITK